MYLTPEQTALLPTDDDVQFYRDHGWYRSGRIFDNDLIDRALDACERHFNGERDWLLRTETGFSDWKPADATRLRNGQATALQNRVLRELALHPMLGAIAARLTGSPVIRYFDDSIIGKLPEGDGDQTVVGWHTDRAYWGTCTSDEMITAWIPLTDMEIDMGPIMYIDGSHEWGFAEQMRTFHSKDLAAIEDRLVSTSATTHAMSLARGEASFHNCRTIHASGQNRSAKQRVAMAVHMQDASNRYREHIDTFGRPWRVFQDEIVRRDADGRPDYGDERVFAVMWSSPSGDASDGVRSR